MNTTYEVAVAPVLSGTDSPLTLNIAREFADSPGWRYRTDGPNSGEEFREKLLKPRFVQALEQGRKLLVNLDGTPGYTTAFLDEAFAGLAREFGVQQVLNRLEFHCIDEPFLPREIQFYVRKVDRG